MTSDVLGLEGYETVHYEENANSVTVLVECEKEGKRICPGCGSMSCYSDGRRLRHYRDIEFKGKFCEIAVNTTRLKCRDCGTTCYPDLPGIAENFRMTKRLYDMVCEDCFKFSFTDIANMHGMERRTVKRIFDEYYRGLNARWIVKAPRVLGIDECHLAKDARAVFVEMDRKTGNRLIEMAVDSKKDTVIKVLEKMVVDENEYPHIVTMDFTKRYREAIYEVLPQASVVIDHYHVQQLVTDATSKAYNLVVKKQFDAWEALDADERRKKRNKWNKIRMNVRLVRINVEDLEPNQKDRLTEAIKLVPDIATVIMCKEGFRDIFNKIKNRKIAEKAFDDWQLAIPKDSEFDEFREVAKTIRRWHKEVFNFFDHGRHSNGPVEAINGVIKQLNRVGRGYSFEVIRAKALFKTIVSSKPRYERVPIKMPKPGTEYFFTGIERPPKPKLIEGCGVNLDELLAALEKEPDSNYLDSYYEPNDFAAEE